MIRFYPLGFLVLPLLKVPYLQAFGLAAHSLLPHLVHDWVTGGQSSKKAPSARLNDDELEPRIIAGKILFKAVDGLGTI